MRNIIIKKFVWREIGLGVFSGRNGGMDEGVKREEGK